MLNVNQFQHSRSTEEIKRHSFQLKPVQRNGLLLRLHNIQSIPKKQYFRFIKATYHPNGYIFAISDASGNIFIVDVRNSKLWCLPHKWSFNVMQFSNCDEDELLICTKNDNHINIVDIHSGKITMVLTNNNAPVTSLCLSTNNLCLAYTRTEANIYNLKNYSLFHCFVFEEQSSLAYAAFVPITNDVLTFTNDGFTYFWKYANDTYEFSKQVFKSEKKRFPPKFIAFTKNGFTLVMIDQAANMVTFSVDSWSGLKRTRLPKCLETLRQIEFISQPCDDGCNRILAMLSKAGSIYFYNIENRSIVSQLQSTAYEILKFACSNDGKHMCCILSSGEVNLFEITQYLSEYAKGKKTSLSKERKGEGDTKTVTPIISRKIEKEQSLDVPNVKTLVKKFGQYPDEYRVFIWKRLLSLPENVDCYKALLEKSSSVSLNQFVENVRLQNNADQRNLKRLLGTLISWVPFLAEVDFLPEFVFPFVKFMNNDPLACFELICTIIVNWWVTWLEFHPLPPFNILSIIEETISAHDTELFDHLNRCNVTSFVYAWTLMKTALSEVLTKKEWLTAWDHIVTGEPFFFLMFIAAYSLCSRGALLRMTTIKDFLKYYRNQNSVNVQSIISKAYKLTTSSKDELKQRINKFEPLPTGSYPFFELTVRGERIDLRMIATMLENLGINGNAGCGDGNEHAVMQNSSNNNNGKIESGSENNLRLSLNKKLHAIGEKLDKIENDIEEQLLIDDQSSEEKKQNIVLLDSKMHMLELEISSVLNKMTSENKLCY